MSGFWQVTNRNAAGVASATQNNAGSATVGGQQLRVRSISASSSVAGTLTIVDSSGSVTVFSLDLAAAGTVTLPDLDIRTTGNMTIAWSASGITDVNAQGDYVLTGYAAYGP